MHIPHDELCHAILRHPELAAAWIRSALPARIADAIDWKTFRPADSRVQGTGLRSLHTDLSYVADLLSGSGLVVFVIECKAGPDRGLHAQALRYVVHIARVLQRRHEMAAPLVLPLVLCHGGDPIVTPTLPLLPEATARAFRRHQPRLRLLVTNLTGTTEDEVVALPLPAAVRLLFLFLEQARSTVGGALLACLHRWGPLLRQLETESGPHLANDLLEAFGWYLVETSDLTDMEIRMAIHSQLNNPENAPMTTGQRIRLAERSQGRAEGHAEGLAEGLAKGRAEGQAAHRTARDALVKGVRKVVLQRFGSISRELFERIEAASLEELEHGFERALTVPTPETVFEQG
jgi:hypothetical protein